MKKLLKYYVFLNTTLFFLIEFIGCILLICFNKFYYFHVQVIATLFVASCSANYYYNEAPAPINGVPQDTAEVQHAKAAHLAAVAKAQAGAHSSYPSYAAPQQYNHAPAYYNHAPAHYNHGPAHFEAAPAPINGVPQDTAEVKHAKAAHFALYSQAQSGAAHAYPAQYAPAAYYPSAHGVPEDTYEVKAAKAKHFAALAAVNSGHGNGYGHEDDGSYKPQNYDGHYH